MDFEFFDKTERSAASAAEMLLLYLDLGVLLLHGIDGG